MKWGKKKPSTSLINHVFPVSWLSKFKQKKNGNTEHQEAAKMKHKGKVNLTSLTSPTTNVSLKEGRFYGGDDDDDPYWRLSFTEDRFEAHPQNQQIQNPLWNGSYDECDQVSAWNSKILLAEENHEFNNMVSRKITEKHKKMWIAQKEAEFSNRKRNAIKDEKLRKLSRKALEERIAENAREPDQQEEEEEEERATEVIEKDIFEIEPENEKVMQKRKEKSRAYCTRKTRSVTDSSQNTVKETYMFESLNLEDEADELSEEEFESECLEMKDMKNKDMSEKSEYQQRKSVYINQKRRRKHGVKIRAYSPRTTAKIECRIKALEDMKKAKMKMRQETKSGGDRTVFDSYAVVKSSFDPFRDFRESMLEMIIQRGIKNSEELEELLACYLTLNCDEYHDLIIKVFRQVWFELYQVNIGAGLQNCCCSDDLTIA